MDDFLKTITDFIEIDDVGHTIDVEMNWDAKKRGLNRLLNRIKGFVAERSNVVGSSFVRLNG